MNDWTRRDVLAMLGAAAVTPLARSAWRGPAPDPADPGFRIRTITAGTTLRAPADTERLHAALTFLKSAKRAVADAGYEVQTVRIATQPFPEYIRGMKPEAAVAFLAKIDALATKLKFRPSIGTTSARAFSHGTRRSKRKALKMPFR